MSEEMAPCMRATWHCQRQENCIQSIDAAYVSASDLMKHWPFLAAPPPPPNTGFGCLHRALCNSHLEVSAVLIECFSSANDRIHNRVLPASILEHFGGMLETEQSFPLGESEGVIALISFHHDRMM